MIIIGGLFSQNLSLQLANKDLQNRLIFIEEQANQQQLLMAKLDNSLLFIKTSGVLNQNSSSWLFWSFCVFGVGVAIAFTVYSFSPQSEVILQLANDQNHILANHASKDTEIIMKALRIMQESNRDNSQLVIEHLHVIQDSLSSLKVLTADDLSLINITANVISSLPVGK